MNRLLRNLALLFFLYFVRYLNEKVEEGWSHIVHDSSHIKPPPLDPYQPQIHEKSLKCRLKEKLSRTLPFNALRRLSRRARLGSIVCEPLRQRKSHVTRRSRRQYSLYDKAERHIIRFL